MEVTNASGIKQQILVKQQNSSHCSALGLKLLSDDEFIEELSCVHLISIYHFLTLKLEYMRLLLLRNEDTSRVPSQMRRAPDSVTLGWKPSTFNRSISLPPGPTSWEKLWGQALMPADGRAFPVPFVCHCPLPVGMLESMTGF